MKTILAELLDYISSVTPEQAKKDWIALEEYNEVGPIATVYVQQCIDSLEFSINKIEIINNYRNPEYTLDFIFNY